MNMMTRISREDVELVRLDPSCIKLWHGNARDRGSLNETNCSELIESIAKDGGNLVPVIVRRIPGDNLYFELIAGMRRHFAVDHLQRFHPDLLLLAQVVTLSDEDAFRIADIENKDRNDVSAVERGRNYAWARDTLYNGKQCALAAALGRKAPWVSRYLRIAAIPDEVLQAFASPTDLAAKPAYKLAQALDDVDCRPGIIARAQELAREQDERKGDKAMSGTKVLKRLLNDASPQQGEPLAAWSSKSGQPALTLKKRDRNGLNLMVHKNTDATIDELVESFREALASFGTT